MDKNNIAIPVAIILAGALVAGAVYLGGKKTEVPVAPTTDKNQPALSTDVRPVDKNDHQLGNPGAKVTIIEYSDLQCPYCQAMHKSLEEIMKTYGKDGKVSWVYRQFPLIDINPRTKKPFHEYAQKAAEASECATEQGGNDKFWAFISEIFSDDKGQESKVANLGGVAKTIGLDQVKFDACLASGKYTQKINDSLAEGKKLGINGTPTSFVLVDGKVVTSIPGFVEASELKTGIDSVLK